MILSPVGVATAAGAMTAGSDAGIGEALIDADPFCRMKGELPRAFTWLRPRGAAGWVTG